MSRWIDGEWLLNFFEPYPDNYQTPLGTLRACVDDAPSLDLVRCGECVENSRNCDGTEDWCLHFGYDVEPSDFCSYGERGESE